MNMNEHDVDRRVLVTGATGYVGGRLTRLLATRGFAVRCMARRPSNLVGKVPDTVEIVHGDATEPITLDAALEGIHTAYYLVHSLATTGDLESTELRCAQNFAEAAKRANVQRVIYLGGLGVADAVDSKHMRSRHAVGKALRDSSLPTLEFRASIIIGSGSLSFELVRNLVNRLPIMIVPKWVRVKAQPIAIDDVLRYLMEAIEVPMKGSIIYEIGGSEQLSYLDLMKRYSQSVGLSRIYSNVPFLSPWLSSLWLNLVTPLFANVGRKLIESIQIASVVVDDKALEAFSVTPIGVDEAIARALRNEDIAFMETHWSGAISTTRTKPIYGGRHYRSRIADSRIVRVETTRQRAFEAVERIGGETGWYYGDWLWEIRSYLDRLVGGVGMGRGRRNVDRLYAGDVVDCWRVELVERKSRLLLRAEIKVFGRAWLQFEVDEQDALVEIRQTAIYDPRGLAGLVYWYMLYPLHEFVFSGMLNGIALQSVHGDKELIRQASQVAP